MKSQRVATMAPAVEPHNARKRSRFSDVNSVYHNSLTAGPAVTAYDAHVVKASESTKGGALALDKNTERKPKGQIYKALDTASQISVWDLSPEKRLLHQCLRKMIPEKA